ncbi:protein-export membrane protein SecD [Candidatus Roizmanbacteria bacterium RIFCSPHIGHO2_01_FULL_38_15]|nr:MAG: protein-export membrane protein SecD [Candidatus Roizmanbacteria bacterium RIFCSPHIGHO2_01_FULL_38_15]OGK35823.1 MAG: protein-export membrane protein SecD [Candidatus Roizmanbacteria bacterium RIFCSPHIGHO2_12_FULL_38_13]
MKFIRYLTIIVLLVLILWVDLPRSIPIKFTLFERNFDLSIRPLVISYNFGETTVRKSFETKLGLDLRGGSHLVFEANTKNVKPSDLEDALESARDVIERRVNLFGVSEPVVRTIKTGNIYRITVDLPGVDDVSQAVGLIGQTAQLTFREMGDNIGEKEATSTPIFAQLTKDTGFNGKHIKKASVTFDQQTGAPQVGLNFTDEGGKIFAEVTKRNVGQPVGIFLDQFIVSAPVVEREITGGQAVITGQFTLDDAKQMAIAINSGALPIPIKLVEQRNVGPSLGAVEVERSVIAGLIGLSMVMIFMIFYYGRLGVAACIALILYGLITFSIFRTIPIVLTLPGIAGFVLSIGMAVDANILIFERIKDERRAGKSFETAVRLGFGRALDAIKDANITTILVAFILFNPLNWEFLPQFGLVRGFALTLGIGVLTSLFTGIFITRRLIWLFYSKK